MKNKSLLKVTNYERCGQHDTSYGINFILLILLTAIGYHPNLTAQNETELRTDGILFPRLDSNGIGTELTGLVYYDTLSSHLLLFDGAHWKPVAGPFELRGSTVRQEKGYETNDFIFGREALPENGEVARGTFFFFDKSKSAFRGGETLTQNWAPDSLGTNSFAYGFDVKATGVESTAFGIHSTASGEASTALGGSTASGDYGATSLGANTVASGDFGAIAAGSGSRAIGNYGAIAIGLTTEASGDFGAVALGNYSYAAGDNGSSAIGHYTTTYGSNGATALGDHTTANGNSCTVLGLYNDTLVAKGTAVSSTSPIFVIGNGDSGIGNESNAMVVRKDGNIGIGNTNPGVKFKVGNGGDGTVARANAWDVFSDRRHKRNISDLENSLGTVNKLQGRSFIWKDSGKEDLGFIAQEVEAVISQIVTTDADGYKSMDYGKIVPLLVEAIKELTDEVRGQKKMLTENQKQIDELRSLFIH